MNVCKTKDNETRIHVCDTQRERANERAHAREKSARARARKQEKAVRIPDSRPGIMWTWIVRVTRIMSIVSEEKEYSKHGACDMIL